jgi:hypothetical protein
MLKYTSGIGLASPTEHSTSVEFPSLSVSGADNFFNLGCSKYYTETLYIIGFAITANIRISCYLKKKVFGCV